MFSYFGEGEDFIFINCFCKGFNKFIGYIIVKVVFFFIEEGIELGEFGYSNIIRKY